MYLFFNLNMVTLRKFEILISLMSLSIFDSLENREFYAPKFIKEAITYLLNAS